MGRQHKEIRHRLEDAEKLLLYAKASASEHRALEESLARPSLDLDIRNGRPRRAPRRQHVRKKRETRLRRKLARLAAVEVGDARANMEGDLARVKDALAAAKEARAVAEEAKRKLKSEAVRLEVDRTSLLLELRMVKEEVSSLQSQAGKDKEAMEKEY